MVRGQRKGAVASLLVVALQPARLAAKGAAPGQNGRFAAFDPGEGWGARATFTQSAQLRRPTMEHLEKVRSQFLSLRHSDVRVCSPPSPNPLKNSRIFSV